VLRVNDDTAETRMPSGTVTFLFTDIEGSTRLSVELGPRWELTLDEHRRRIRAAVAAAGGREVSTDGDALFVVFGSPSAAVAAAARAQRALAEPWPDGRPIRVRMGVHTGEAALTAGDYVGYEVHRAARVAAAGHGGQVLVSSATRALVEDRLPEGVSLRDLGDYHLKDIARPERLSQLVIEGLPNDFPSPRTLDATPNNLPVQLTSFVGRAELLAEARSLLERTRLLTLTGPGGTGKTRLALELAADVATQFSDGVFFVALASLSDPALFAPTVAAAATIPPTGTRPPMEQLMEGLRGKRTLIVLDNFEQLLGAAPYVAELLRGTDLLKVLVTSRAILRVSGEQELPVPPLALPDPKVIRGVAALSQYDAVRLFIERAMAARPDFEVTNENAPAIAEIAARLDGLPLAIELAAARLRLLSPQAILARLGDRLGLLSGGARDLPARQQTLRAAIAWSYDLLDAAERDLFERLGAFVNGWTLEAAEALGAAGEPPALDVFEGLGSLSEKSLVRSFEDAHGHPRFLMLETIHAFAMERFAARPDVPELRRAHAEWYATLVADAAQDIAKGARRSAFERLEDDLGNLRAALDWLTAHDLPGAARFATNLWRFWQMRGYLVEGRMRLDAVLAADDEAHALSTGERRQVLSAAGGVAYWQGDLMSTHHRYREALDLARAHGTKAEVAEALYDFSFAPRPPIDLPSWERMLAVESTPFLNEAMDIFRELGDRAGLAKSLWARAEYDFFRGDFSRAGGDLNEALVIFREQGDRFQISWTLHSLGLAQTVLGDYDAAREAYTSAARMFVEDGDVSGMTLILVDFAGLALALGQRQRASRLTGAAEEATRRTGAGLASTSMRAEYFPAVPTEPAAGSPDRAAWDEGMRMTLDEAVVYALETPADEPAPG
jgi:predicted ATPase/class 3 adenylate cyclase